MSEDANADRLAALLAEKRDELIAAWTGEIRRAITAAALPRAELLDRMPEFVDQIIAALHPQALPLPPAAENAEEHGAQRLRIGFDVAEVIQEYGLLHRCILQISAQAAITPTLREQEIMARWLNAGIADAVGQYVRQRDAEMQRQTSEHLGFIAHELRNPLSTARMSFQRLTATIPAMTGRWVSVLDRNLRRTVDLIDGVLGQASLDLGIEPALKPLPLDEFLHEIVADAEAEAQSRDVQLNVTVEPGVVMHADPRLIRSAVTNLLHNAIKFSERQGQVSLTAGQAGSRLEIAITDACGGLPAGKAEELFKPLIQRGDNRSGFGLGLSIALQAVQAHRGTIHVRDVPGNGCVFTIDLPAASPVS
jgi:signal transduction histidine kinase